MRWSRRPTIAASLAAALACAVTTIGLIAGGAAPAGAHATLIGTAPAADEVIDAVPEIVELRFDEPVDTVEGAVQVVGPDGERVDLGTVQSLDGGATLRAPVDTEASDQGTYTVAWRVTSEDSHTITGSFVFHNGTQTGAADLDDGGGDTATDVAGGIGRWLAFAGTLAAVGAAALALLVPRAPHAGPSGGGLRAAGDADGLGGSGAAGEGGDGVGPAGDDPSDLAGAAVEGGRSSGLAGATTGAGSAADPAGAADRAGAGAGTATLIATQAGAPSAPAVSPEADGAAAGRAAAVARLRTLAAAGALVGAAGAFLAFVATVAETTGRNVYDAVGLVPDLATDTRTSQLAVARVALGLAAAAAAAVPALWRRTPVPALAASGAALVTWSLAGHAWTAPDRWVAVVSDVVHVGAVAVWIGGVLALLAALPLLGVSDGGEGDGGGDRVRVAGRFSGLALAAAGAVAVSGTVSGWQQVRSFDGLVDTGYGRLLLAKVAGFGVLVVLGWANRYRLVPLVARAVGPLRRSLRVEVLVAATVLAITAALIHQPPARSDTASGPYDATVTAEGGEVVAATVDPASAGTNDIHLYFYDADGTEPLAVDAVQVTASTTDVPARRLQVTPVTTNHVTVAGASLPSAGTWTVEVTAVVAGEPLLFTFEVPIA